MRAGAFEGEWEGRFPIYDLAELTEGRAYEGNSAAKGAEGHGAIVDHVYSTYVQSVVYLWGGHQG